jgi:hypothetical protein
LRHKVDPEDVVQSAYKRFFARISPATRRRVEGVRRPVQRQVEAAVEADQLGQDGGQGPRSTRFIARLSSLTSREGWPNAPTGRARGREIGASVQPVTTTRQSLKRQSARSPTFSRGAQ